MYFRHYKQSEPPCFLRSFWAQYTGFSLLRRRPH